MSNKIVRIHSAEEREELRNSGVAIRIRAQAEQSRIESEKGRLLQRLRVQGKRYY
jgi:hypothetical protein